MKDLIIDCFAGGGGASDKYSLRMRIRFLSGHMGL